MAVPKSVVKIKKDTVEFTSNVERTKYLLNELTRAALRDTGKFITRTTKNHIRRRTGRVAKNTQYWVRKKDCDLQTGFKPQGFYGMFQELGTKHQKKIGALTSAVEDNIKTIREIQGTYLSEIENENKALAAVSEDEYEGE